MKVKLTLLFFLVFVLAIQVHIITKKLVQADYFASDRYSKYSVGVTLDE